MIFLRIICAHNKSQLFIRKAGSIFWPLHPRCTIRPTVYLHHALQCPNLLERATRFELATHGLGSRYSTTELRPHPLIYRKFRIWLFPLIKVFYPFSLDKRQLISPCNDSFIELSRFIILPNKQELGKER